MNATGWSDLPPDLAREISGRLQHDAVDLARFHAVCKPWRDSRTATATTQFLPWLVAAVNHEDASRLEMRCILSGSNYRSQPLLSEPASGNWVTSYGGTVLRCLTIEGLRPSLHDPLTGAAAHLPLLPQSLGLWGEEIDPHGLIYGDGATLLYSISIAAAHVVGPRPTARFTAALLRPGDAEWTILERSLEHEYEHQFRSGSPRQPVLSSVTYHDGKILAVMEADQPWRLVTPNSNIARDELVQSPLAENMGLSLAYNHWHYYSSCVQDKSSLTSVLLASSLCLSSLLYNYIYCTSIRVNAQKAIVPAMHTEFVLSHQMDYCT